MLDIIPGQVIVWWKPLFARGGWRWLHNSVIVERKPLLEVKPAMRTAILYSEKMREYDLGHVLTGERYESFMRLFREKLGDNPAFEIVEPDYATEADLKLVHTEEYIRRVERCESRDPYDTPLSPGVVRAAKLLAGAGRLAGELV